MKNAVQISGWWESIREAFTSLSIFAILALSAALFLGVAIGAFDWIYGVAVAGALVFAIIVLFRWDELTVTLIIAVHVVIDWYLSLRLVSVLMALVLLFACYFGQSVHHPWVKPRPLWLWGLFLVLTIYPAVIGGSFRLYDAD